MKVKDVARMPSRGPGLGVGVTMYRVQLQGSESSFLVEWRSNKGMYNLMPPFGIVAIHGRCAIDQETKDNIAAAIHAL